MPNLSRICAYAFCLSTGWLMAQTAPVVTAPFEGQKSVAVTYAAPTATQTIKISLCVDDTKQAACAASASALTADSTGKATIGLTSAPKKGQWVMARQDVTDNGTTTTLLSDAVQVKAMAAAAYTSSNKPTFSMVTGTAQAPDSKPFTEVDVYVCASLSAAEGGKVDCSDDANKTKRLAVLPAAAGGSSDFTTVGSNGNWSANLASPVNSTLYMWLVSKAKIGSDIVATSISASTYSTTPSVKPTINKVQAGDNNVTGNATKSVGDDKVKVQLMKGNASTPNVPLQRVGYETEVGTDGRFNISYGPLEEGDTLQVVQTSPGPTIPIDDKDLQSEVVGVGQSDNERVNIDFTGGILLSQSNNSFSQANMFVDVNIDDTFWRPGLYNDTVFGCDASGKRVTGNTKPSAFCKKNRHPAVNGFFDLRITAVPVSSTEKTTTTTSGVTTPATTYDSFLVSRKTAHFETGVYVPFYFGRVGLNSEKKQAFFFAPVGRFGVNTLIADDGGTTATVSGNTTTTSVTTPIASDANNKVYGFWTFGGRVGVSDLRPGAPRIAHYLDVGLGKFSNLRNLYCPTSVQSNCQATNGATTATDPTLLYHYTPFRVYMEGAIDVHGFVLGFSVNKSQNALLSERPKIARTAGTNFSDIKMAPDDTRFLIGYRLDLDKLLGVAKSKGF